ncbi:Ppx/GppA phosphatase family protein [Thalassoroseus pseudoceratinae]|uniref:Ppx/GppA phosphatase family protein n=1 Tax=Thalassoroseus pseudoceratinae TaxID=2713176 RepID=UPI001423C01D|nr:HD domain-containing protein [Thalassoroseus pseudoceratinae]
MEGIQPRADASNRPNPSVNNPIHPVAVIDVGTSSIRMAIAELHADGQYRTLETLSQSVSLGKDTFSRGRIARSTIEDAVRVLRSYRKLLREYGIERSDQIRVVATSAVREADNRLAFLDRVYSATGLDVQALDEAEVNRITYLGVQPLLKSRPELAAARAVIMEIGGGSTEILVVHRGDVLYSHTFRLGSLRLRKMLDSHNETRSQERQIMRTQIGLTIEEIIRNVPAAEGPTDQGLELIALGGDVRYAASQATAPSTPQEIEEVPLAHLEKLANNTLDRSVDELVRSDHLSVPDAESLGPSLLGYVLLAQRLQLNHVLVCDANLRDGLLQDMAARDAWMDDYHEQVIRSAVSFGRKLEFDEDHALHVANLTRHLFEQLEKEHELPPRYGLILYLAALLHEIGFFIGTRGYHKHTYYLIINSELFGMSKHDLQLVATVARYHRRSSPKPTHEMYMRQSRENRIAISQMAAMLRVAIALGRSRSRRVRELQCSNERNRIVITVPHVEELAMEQLALKQSGSLFEEIFGKPPMLRTESLPQA